MWSERERERKQDFIETERFHRVRGREREIFL